MSMTAILWMELLLEVGISGLIAWMLALHANLPVLVAWCLPLCVVLVVRVGLVLISATLSMYWQTQPALSLWQRMQWLARESLALLRFCWLILSERSPPAMPPLQAGQPLVVLLHGVYCNRGIWRPVLRHLKKARSQCAFLAPNLDPVSASLDVQARHFAHWLNAELEQQPQVPVILVGYSMGGLIARLCVEQQLLHASVKKLICIGTPHAGSRFADYLPGTIAQDLRIGSVALTKLNRPNLNRRNANRPGNAAMPVIINLYSQHDSLVVPFHSAHLPVIQNEVTDDETNGDEAGGNEIVDALGHMSMLYAPQVQSLIVRHSDVHIVLPL
jgi:pimeloyl-ACP methyl ester carboxylesterase